MTVLTASWLEAKLGLDLRTHNSGFGCCHQYLWGLQGKSSNGGPHAFFLTGSVTKPLFIKNVNLQGFHLTCLSCGFGESKFLAPFCCEE